MVGKPVTVRLKVRACDSLSAALGVLWSVCLL
nr:MAG TPA: hypothetical protein [Bacteriophage sp.]